MPSKHSPLSPFSWDIWMAYLDRVANPLQHYHWLLAWEWLALRLASASRYFDAWRTKSVDHKIQTPSQCQWYRSKKIPYKWTFKAFDYKRVERNRFRSKADLQSAFLCALRSNRPDFQELFDEMIRHLLVSFRREVVSDISHEIYDLNVSWAKGVVDDTFVESWTVWYLQVLYIRIKYINTNFEPSERQIHHQTISLNKYIMD